MKSRFLPLACSLALFVSLIVSSPASAEFEPPQRSAWGLAGPETSSNAVSRFSALGWAVEELNNFMYVGGKFQNVTNGDSTISQPNFARFSLEGEFDPSFTPDVTEPVLSVAAGPDGNLFLGGELGSYNGESVGALVKVDPATGNKVSGFDLKLTGSTQVVREVTVEPDGWAYAVGSFTDVRHNGAVTSVSNIVRFDPVTGAPDTSWTPSFNGGLWDVSVSRLNNSVYVAGWYSKAAGVNVIGAVGVDTNDASSLTWSLFPGNHPTDRTAPAPWDSMYGIEATEHGHVWVVGEQHSVWVFDEQSSDPDYGYELVRDHITNCHSTLQGNDCTRRGGEFQEIERVGDRMYITCHCWGHHMSGDGPDPMQYGRLDTVESADQVVTGSISGIAAYDVASADRDQSFNPYMAGDVGGFGVAQASDGCLWTVGGFNAVGNPADGPQAPGRDMVRLCDGGGFGDLTAPASCAAALDGLAVDVSWPAATGASEYVVYRTVDGSQQFWRGKTSDLTFSDVGRSGDLVYYVVSKRGSEVSAATQCNFDDLNPPLAAPASCQAAVNGDNVNVNWPVASGAAEYIVYRTVNGSQQFWRGRTSTTSFADSNIEADLLYFVAGKGGDGTVTSRTQCGFEGPDVVPVDNCSVVTAGDAATITWNGAAGADRYIIRREVDGGTRFWRGAVDAPGTSFDDSLRDGTIEYFVSAKFGFEFAEDVSCTSN